MISHFQLVKFSSLFEGQLPALENVSQHTLIATLKANIRMSEQGLGLIIIQNGPYLQITSLVEKSFAANDGKLKPGKKKQQWYSNLTALKIFLFCIYALSLSLIYLHLHRSKETQFKITAKRN